MENQELQRNTIGFEERRKALEDLVIATTKPNNTEEEREFVQTIRDQACYTLYQKSWKEAKQQALQDIEKNNLSKNNDKE